MAEISFFDRVATHTTHVPDVLSCIANLSNDEVFTPPEVVNKMLDLLPQELFADPKTTFLDPATKTGVFLREIAKRCLDAQLPGYKERSMEISEKKKLDIPLDEYDIAFEKQLQEKIDHIFHNQLFGIGITELTSLLARRSVYCSKWPNGPYSITHFDDSEGNIRFRRTEHAWEPKELMYINGKKVGKCVYCGATREEYDRGDVLESHAYEFIHTVKPEEIFDMQFDVIIGNPPYQLNDGGGTGMSAKPIYQYFINQAKKLNSRYISMIIPSRWFSGGKGLDDFRESMLKDKHIRKLVDFENYKDVFPTLGGLAGGVCYFLWDRENEGDCEITNMSADESITMVRKLDEYSTFIRSNRSVSIVNKILGINSNKTFLNERISSRLPFGITTTYKPVEKGVPCYFTQRVGVQPVRAEDVTDAGNVLNKWKFLIPKAPIAGQTDFTKPVGFYYDGNTRIAKPGECCSESWLVAGAFDTEEEAINYKSYIFTKIARFLLLQTVVSQNITKKNFCFVPDVMDYSHAYTDEMLCKEWNITDEEWAHICSRIGEIGKDNLGDNGGEE
jgi:site-specific DNA-methyltransferase (adenine-specific)